MLLLLSEACKSDTLLIIDEAFIDFVEDKESFTLVKEASANEHILILGSFGKFFSLAGLRLGYLVASLENCRKIKEMIAPWNVNSLAQVAAPLALRDKFFICQSRFKIRRERDFLSCKIAEFPVLNCYPSAANFILVRIKSNDFTAVDLADYLGSKGILIRVADNFVGLDKSYFRLAVLDRVSNLKLLDEINNFMLRRNRNAQT